MLCLHVACSSCVCCVLESTACDNDFAICMSPLCTFKRCFLQKPSKIPEKHHTRNIRTTFAHHTHCFSVHRHSQTDNIQLTYTQNAQTTYSYHTQNISASRTQNINKTYTQHNIDTTSTRHTSYTQHNHTQHEHDIYMTFNRNTQRIQHL